MKMKDLLDRVAGSNEQYKAATDAEKRVMIAKDVIASLKAKELEPETSTYVEFGTSYGAESTLSKLRDVNPLQSFQAAMATLPACRVCAKGAIFVCAVARQNEVTLGDMGLRRISDFSGSNMERLLGGVFEAAQLRLIELEFEGEDVEGEEGEGDYTEEPTMGLDNLEAEDRMIAIMNNIIDNGGEFRP